MIKVAECRPNALSLYMVLVPGKCSRNGSDSSSSPVRSHAGETRKLKMLYEQFLSPNGQRKIPFSPTLSCLACPHTSCPLEWGQEHVDGAAGCGPWGWRDAASHGKKAQRASKKRPTTHHTFSTNRNIPLDHPKEMSNPLPSDPAAFILFQMEGTLPFW